MKQIKAEQAKVAADRLRVTAMNYGGHLPKNECYDEGRCSVNSTGSCVASNDKDCESSSSCRKRAHADTP